MIQDFRAEHWAGREGNPEGGTTYGPGFAISWQNGPLGRHVPGCQSSDGGFRCWNNPVPGCTRKHENGAFVETIIAAARDRLEYYQSSKFKCGENAEAILHLNNALTALNSRTLSRNERGVEGTHTV